MNIVVFVKQVPDTEDVKWTANNNIDRANTESILNPIDAQALCSAVKLKEQYSVKISAVSMGPNKAVEVLKETIAMGADDAFLLSDSKFVGSDTCATSKVLAAAICEKFPDIDLIIFGQSASDGETAQTGPSTAVRLNLPCITHVSEIIDISDGFITVISETETEKITYKLKLPAVLCINNNAAPVSLPKISGYINAHNYKFKTYKLSDLNLSDSETGVKGSPTYVSKVYKTQEYRNCKMIGISELLQKIKEVC